ncbi:MAG: Rieske (2Fe-2S) protein [bacterium]|nr:Rieske (2Fe-2S) protein [bacterium]
MSGEFTKVGKVDEFPQRRGRAVKVGGRTIAVFRTPEGWRATVDACPHMGASLADGKVEGGRVECHWHHWNFDLGSGECDTKSWCRIPVYPVRIEGDDVLVELPPDEEKGVEPKRDDDDDEWVRWDDSFLKKE